MNTPPASDDELLNLLLSGELSGMEDTEFIRRYFPAENIGIGWECFERWAEARKDKIKFELFQIDPANDPVAIGITFAPAEQ